MKLETAEQYQKIITDLLTGRVFTVVSTVPSKSLPEVKTGGALRECYTVDRKNGNGTVGMSYTVNNGLNGYTLTGCDRVRIDSSTRTVTFFSSNAYGELCTNQFVLSDDSDGRSYDEWKAAENKTHALV
jgi:hypothetical protein